MLDFRGVDGFLVGAALKPFFFFWAGWLTPICPPPPLVSVISKYVVSTKKADRIRLVLNIQLYFCTSLLCNPKKSEYCRCRRYLCRAVTSGAA